MQLVELTVPHEDNVMSGKITALRILLENVRRRGGKQRISQWRIHCDELHKVNESGRTSSKEKKYHNKSSSGDF